MQHDHIMHLRSLNPYDAYPNQDKFDATKRGVSVYAVVEEGDSGDMKVTYGWAVQNPKDQYNKNRGIKLAEERIESDEFVTVQSDYYPNFPMKYQFFNAVGLAREHIKANPSKFSKKEQDFVDLTFGTLCQIAYDNQWFYNVDPTGIPKIHPDIMVNFISRMQDERSKRKCDLKKKYIDPLIVSFGDKVGRYYAM